jgi:hypothetical protein
MGGGGGGSLPMPGMMGYMPRHRMPMFKPMVSSPPEEIVIGETDDNLEAVIKELKVFLGSIMNRKKFLSENFKVKIKGTLYSKSTTPIKETQHGTSFIISF